MVTTKTNLTPKRTVGFRSRDIIGIHTMEAPEALQTAENVANYFKRVNASSHWCVDGNSRVRVVMDRDTAWTLPGANSRSLNIEIAGYAKQTRADWSDKYSINALEIAALCAAEWCMKYEIPVRKLTDSQIRSGYKGFAGHVDVNRVYKKSAHWDPGPGFPWEYFLDRVNAQIAKLKGKNPPKTSIKVPTPSYDNHGYSTDWIKDQQTKLKKLGYKVTPDGFNGPVTEKATKDFQKKHGLKADGIPGPTTAKLLDAAVKKPTATIKPVKKPAKPEPVKVKINVRGLQRSVRAKDDNVWGADTEARYNALRAASRWGGRLFPRGIQFTQQVIGTATDNVWGKNSEKAMARTVTNVQKHLKKLGYDPGNIDGAWGPSTEAAYQSARHRARL